MPSPRPVPERPIDWSAIDTVLLDMDGTLLDLGFDNWFWQHNVPARYAERQGLSLAAAAEELRPRFAAAQGTLAWYCIDHWSRELGLDIRALKRACGARVALLPGAEAFLARLKASGKRRILVTNAHPATLEIKTERVPLAPWFDELHSTHDYGLPKEAEDFWGRLAVRVPFDPARTLLVDDSLPVLRSARRFGIRWLRAIRRPDLGQPPRHSEDLPGIDSVADLWPAPPHGD